MVHGLLLTLNWGISSHRDDVSLIEGKESLGFTAELKQFAEQRRAVILKGDSHNLVAQSVVTIKKIFLILGFPSGARTSTKMP
jgi:hypothetical protein